MLITADIIRSVRYKVGDTQKTKYTDERMLDLVNEALGDVSRLIDVARGEVNIPIIPFQREVVIPDPSLIKLSRVRYEYGNVRIIHYETLDKHYPNWEDVVGNRLQAVVTDLNNPNKVILYPLLSKPETEFGRYNDVEGGVVATIPSASTDAQNANIPTDLKDTSGYASVSVDGDGVITEIKNFFHILNIKYVKQLDKIDSLDDNIELDTMYSSAITYYIAGMLLFDETRGEMVQKGILFLDKYKAEITNIRGINNDRLNKDYNRRHQVFYGGAYNTMYREVSNAFSVLPDASGNIASFNSKPLVVRNNLYVEDLDTAITTRIAGQINDTLQQVIQAVNDANKE